MRSGAFAALFTEEPVSKDGIRIIGVIVHIDQAALFCMTDLQKGHDQGWFPGGGGDCSAACPGRCQVKRLKMRGHERQVMTEQHHSVNGRHGFFHRPL